MLPSLNALRAFGEAARSGSFKSAARALNVSPTAISHHVRGLEESLSVTLFHREGRRLSLTPEGARLAEDVNEAIHQLTRAVERTRARRQDQTVRIAAGPFFAARWLMPRLATFWTRHPDISLEVVPVPRRLAEREVDADIVIEWGEGGGPQLLTLTPVPIASPDLLARLGPIQHPCDLLDQPLIHQRDMSSWAEWFASHDVPAPQPLRGVVFEDANAVLRGAVEGQGVTLGWLPLIRAELDGGLVVQLFDAGAPSKKQYSITRGDTGKRSAQTEAVASWLWAEGASAES